MLDLLEGKKEFISKGLTETEEVKVTLQISIFNQSENFVSESSGTYTIVSADAKYKRFEELYRGALQAVTYKALKNIEVKLSQSK